MLTPLRSRHGLRRGRGGAGCGRRGSGSRPETWPVERGARGVRNVPEGRGADVALPWQWPLGGCGRTREARRVHGKRRPAAATTSRGVEGPAGSLRGAAVRRTAVSDAAEAGVPRADAATARFTPRIGAAGSTAGKEGAWCCRIARSRRSRRSRRRPASAAGIRTGVNSQRGVGKVWGEVGELVNIAHHAPKMPSDAWKRLVIFGDFQ